VCHASSREIQPQNPDIETLTLLCELRKPRTKQQRPFFPVFLHGLLPLWCRQPAAQQRAAKLVMTQTSNLQQAVDWKAAADCSSPKRLLAVSEQGEELHSGLVERSENTVDEFG